MSLQMNHPPVDGMPIALRAFLTKEFLQKERYERKR
jgi:hypothetical protein